MNSINQQQENTKTQGLHLSEVIHSVEIIYKMDTSMLLDPTNGLDQVHDLIHARQLNVN